MKLIGPTRRRCIDQFETSISETDQESFLWMITKKDNEKFSIVSDVCSDVDSSTPKHCVFVEENIQVKHELMNSAFFWSETRLHSILEVVIK